VPRRPKKKGVRDRMFYRDGRGWYLDLRDRGGGRPAIIDRERGEHGACNDFDRAFEIAKGMVAMSGRDPGAEDYAKSHLERKRKRRRGSTVERDRYGLDRFFAFCEKMLSRPPVLSDITKDMVCAFIRWREPQVASQTLAHELHAVSSMMKRAVGEGKAIANPVPTAKEVEDVVVKHADAEWLGIGEAARVLTAAAELDAEAHGQSQRCPFLQPVIACGLLTGGRPGEFLGARISDVDFRAGRFHFRHNEYRLLKRAWHERDIPLWPQLREILEQYIEQRQPRDLLFPSHLTGRMYTNLSDALRLVFKRARIFKRPRFYVTRHTYCATRLQTLDRGEPVSVYTVAAELGHRDVQLIMRTYGHLQRDRQRLPRVEYLEADVTVLERKAAAS
jgi:integrase